jgi:hypothetical protein
MVSFTPQPLYPKGKSPWYTLDRGLVGPQNRSRRGGEEKILIPFRESNHGRPTIWLNCTEISACRSCTLYAFVDVISVKQCWYLLYKWLCRSTSVSIVTRLPAGRLGLDSWRGQRRDFYSSPPLPYRLWCPPSLFSKWYGDKAHLRLVRG